MGWFKRTECNMSSSELKSSSWKKVMDGVAPGSILGPILYLIYAEDMKTSLDSKVHTFVDKTILASTADSEEDAAPLPQTNIEKMLKWAKLWKIILNPLKTVCLTVNRQGGIRSYQVMSGSVVKEVHHKHLGVTLSWDGKWMEHLNNICSSGSAGKRLNILRDYYKSFSKRYNNNNNNNNNNDIKIYIALSFQ